jgi:hypothetical protein
MKKTTLVLLLFVALFSCTSKDKKNVPDVSHIPMDIKLQRFDKDFFAIDTNNLGPALAQLNNKYPHLAGVFLQKVLGIEDGSGERVKMFIRMSQNLHDTINEVFKNTSPIEKDFNSAFRYIKYYFPDYKIPRLITLAGPVDALAQTETGLSPDFFGPDYLAISLQFYLGPQFSVYKDPLFIENVVPAYRSRRFSKEYITADAMHLVINDMFPDKSGAQPLIEQMVEKGKRWYLLDLFMPHAPDSVKTGYTQLQLDWVNANEGLIWTDIVKSEDLQSLSPATIKTYIGEAPFTQGFSQEYSPGNMGQWIGWQIVKKFMSKNPKMNPAELMNTPATKILAEAKYKPK